MKKGTKTINKARYDKLRERYRLLLLLSQQFEFASRQIVVK